MKINLVHGIRDGKMYHIDDVESGLLCNVCCSQCEDRLVAKKGMKITNHFAHYRVENCSHASETSLHFLAKEIIEECGEFMVPSIEFQIGEDRKPYVFYNETKLKFEKIKVEKKLGDIVPDLIGYVNGRPLLIEIAVTHFIDNNKYKKIKDQKISTIEIDLSEYKDGITREELKNLLINKSDKKTWIFNNKLRLIKKTILKETREVVEKYDFKGDLDSGGWHRKCPIYKNGYVTFARNCKSCIFNNRIYKDYVAGGEMSVFCSGKNAPNIVSKIRKLGGKFSGNLKVKRLVSKSLSSSKVLRLF